MQNNIDQTMVKNNWMEVGEKRVISFSKVALPYGWLGNMSAYPVKHEGKVYRTTEALFQSLRFVDFPEVQEMIRAKASPMFAKMVARKHRGLIEGEVERLGEEDVERMKKCLRMKIEQHGELKGMLEETGDAVLIEDVGDRRGESDLFWGAFWVELKDGWSGGNVLGKCWMEIREEMRR